MATSSERSPPPFPDSEDQDLLESEDVGAHVSDDDGDYPFLKPSNPPPTKMDTALPTTNEPSDLLFEPPMDPLSELDLQTENKSAEPLDDFVDLSNNETDILSVQAAATESAVVEVANDLIEIPSDEPSDDFVDLSGSETDSPQEEEAAATEGVPADTVVEGTDPPASTVTTPFAAAAGGPAEETPEEEDGTVTPPFAAAAGGPAEETLEEEDGTVTPPFAAAAGGPAEETLEEEDGTVTPPCTATAGGPAEETLKEEAVDADLSKLWEKTTKQQQQPADDLIIDPLADHAGTPPPVDVKKPSQPPVDLFEDDPGDLFGEPRQTKMAKQLPTSLFNEPDEDIFSEPLGADSKKAVNVAGREERDPKTSRGFGGVGGPLNYNYDVDSTDIFSEEAVVTAPGAVKDTAVNSKTNGVRAEEDADLFSEATVELSLDSPRNDRKKNAMAKPATSAPTLSAAAADLSKPHSASLEELEEEEQEDNFDVNVSVTNPEKIGDGMNAYMAYKVSTQTTLAMFRNKTFTVRRRFSDFLGLYEKLNQKHAPGGFIVPPPPEKSLLGMTKMKVGKDDSSSAEFVERRRAALERYLQRVVCHPSLLQDPDVREFLERDELPRAVSTQALSGAGFLKMINKATDAVSKMTIKMNESDVWFEEKLQEVESADQQFRKLHGLVESLVGHRKELSLNTACFAKSVAMLGSSEDNTALSRALSQLAEVEDKMEQLHQEQASCDSFSFAELIADYIRLLGAVRGSFDHRMKAWQRWQDAQSTLQKKREAEAKLLWANKPDKLQLAKDEISEWEAKVTQYERDFDRVSATVRKEVLRFQKEKVRNFKRQIIKYLESQLQAQQQLIKYWDAFLPEAKAIA